MVLKGLKLRIYPDTYQQEMIDFNFGANRFIWNQMLDMLIKRYENNKDSKFLNAFDLNNLLRQLKIEYPWLRRAESTSLQSTDHDLVEAYKRFFKKSHNFPKFKSKKYPKQSYQSKCVNKNIKMIDKTYIQLPKLGAMKFKSGKHVPKIIKSVTIRKSFTGKYYAVLLVECENQTFEKTKCTVGIDLGVADLAITSDGKKYPTIRFDKLLAGKKHYWEKRLTRRWLGAIQHIQYEKKFGLIDPKPLEQYSNYMKAKIMVAKYNEKIANQRIDYLHKLTTQLVKDYDVIVIEDLKTSNLIKNHKLARAIANQSWRELRSMLEYKCSWYGKELVVVNPYKTSQRCSNCAYDDGKHTLDVREWTCPNCHTNLDRDINASKNIKKLGLEQTLVN
ncbi:transposase [Companilactobacillus allii]|uniref:Transposase n=1 Tax=Companilactobacillus allii TaxID=1847728 RepID=A0A1P8Q5R2_9LACO|nr:RNA-guided endonuclease TnpB family protein [Companilactobacillus allii]APX73163.1 transposase [Companilactobacillus allii]USQ67970.1 transposase [Companilactobacillus allii]